MKNIFIDANIYLNFFDSNKPELKKLLNSLLEVKDSIFISSQIVAEVNRNKLSLAQRSLGNHLNCLPNIQAVTLPEHLEIESKNSQIWNNQSKEIHQRQKDLKKDIEDIIKNNLENIMCSSDNVSYKLNSIFINAQEAYDNEIKAARYRREVGNPPGKQNDPLGDQISWEQFLNNVRSGSDQIWIITKDTDYHTSFKGNIYLNSFMYNELVENNSNQPSIFCFDSLAKGLKHFNDNSSVKIDNLPTEEELTSIAEQELFEASPSDPFLDYLLNSTNSGKDTFFEYLKGLDSNQ